MESSPLELAYVALPSAFSRDLEVITMSVAVYLNRNPFPNLEIDNLTKNDLTLIQA